MSWRSIAVVWRSGVSVPDPVYRAVIQGGIIKIDENQIECFLTMKEQWEGKQVEVIVRLPDRKATHDQHKFYRSTLLKIFAKELGQTVIDTHRDLTAAIMPVDPEKPELGGRSTATFTEREYAEFIEGVYQKAAFMGLILPEPHEVEPRRG
jgi:hypothetical protein